MITYRIKEKSDKVDPSGNIPVILEDGSGNFIDCCVESVNGETCTGSDIVEIYRELTRADVFPKVTDTDRVVKVKDDEFFKEVRIASHNPWKFNTLFSVRREIESLKVLNHPNIVKFHGVVVENGLIVGLCLDKYDYTLEYMLANDVPFDRMRLFKYLVDVVGYLRSSIYVHGDIHDENIMVKASDTSFPYLIDFDCCERAGTEITTTTKCFGEPRSNIITYGCDSSALIEIFKLLFC
ncbi:hypothetical protein BX667DRAFT_510575 [Coemansia mojavensis]|nr:hypothetical protein BX667DRAFT_510575 [Coemansia mojavensis]